VSTSQGTSKITRSWEKGMEGDSPSEPPEETNSVNNLTSRFWSTEL